MVEFVGSDEMVAIQKRMIARQPMLQNCPWLANGDRLLAYLEPDEATWPAVRALAEEDGVLALTLVDQDFAIAEIRRGLGEVWSVDFWDAFQGSATDILPASTMVVASTPLPNGWSIMSAPTLSDADINEVQLLNQAGDVAANPAFAMRGELKPALTVLIRDASGRLVATAFATMMFHPESRLGNTVFVGLVSVAEDARGNGLGKLVNARALLDSHDAMGWSQAVEFVASYNTASRRMVSGCGLSHTRGLVGAIAMRFTERFSQ